MGNITPRYVHLYIQSGFLPHLQLFAKLVSELPPYHNHHLELGIHCNPLLIRHKKYYKARTQAGSKVLFLLNTPIVRGLGMADCLGERVEGDRERRNDVL